MPRDKAIVLASGGLDSCVTTALAARTHELAMLHVDYGQRTEARERKAFTDLADHYGVSERMVLSLDALRKVGGSSLTDPSIEVSAADLDHEGIPTSYVPFRNAHILCAAVSWAEVIGANHLFVGAVEEDSSGYPDCRRTFYDAFEKAIDEGTRPDTSIRIVTPIIHLDKAAIVRRGVELEAPFHLTWSCYTNEDVACGVCDSCALRLRGFQRAGVEDPLAYATRPDYGE
jgi:7-cyano-7-deazaguanine synthase